MPALMQTPHLTLFISCKPFDYKKLRTKLNLLTWVLNDNETSVWGITFLTVKRRQLKFIEIGNYTIFRFLEFVIWVRQECVLCLSCIGRKCLFCLSGSNGNSLFANSVNITQIFCVIKIDFSRKAETSGWWNYITTFTVFHVPKWVKTIQWLWIPTW